MHSRFFRAVVATLLSFGLVGSAAAHSIWVEREGDGARLYFGEFDENLREGSPGLLDRLKPEAKVAGSDKALKLDKQATFFAVAGPLAQDDSILAENVAVTERRGDKPTKVLNRLGARTVADFKELPAVNTLDIVPAGKPGLFKVFYQGKPLAKAKAGSAEPAKPRIDSSACNGRRGRKHWYVRRGDTYTWPLLERQKSQ